MLWKSSDSFPSTDTNAVPEKKYDLQICGYSGPADQNGAVVSRNYNGGGEGGVEGLQWKRLGT